MDSKFINALFNYFGADSAVTDLFVMYMMELKTNRIKQLLKVMYKQMQGEMSYYGLVIKEL